MQNEFQGQRFCATVCVFFLVTAFLSVAPVGAQTVSWGVGNGGSGTWDDTTVNWLDGAFPSSWPSGGNAIFAGAHGGTVNVQSFSVTTSSLTFNTAGYVVQGGWIESGSSGLTVTTNVAATIGSTLANTASGQVFAKEGQAPLTITGTNFFSTVRVDQGELLASGNSSLFAADVTLADSPGVVLTLGTSSGRVDIKSLAGGGAAGGIVQPDNQARTVTASLAGSGTFAGKLQDNGAGVLGVQMASTIAAQTFTNANTYSGPTTVTFGTLTFAGGGAAQNSAATISGGSLVLDNSGAVMANRLSDSKPLTMSSGTLQFIGNSTTPVAENLGVLNLTRIGTVAVDQPSSAAAELNFAGLQRSNSGTLNVLGPGVSFAGVANGATGIVAPYVTTGNDWAVVGGGGRITPLAAYSSDATGGAATDHLKLTGAGTTSLTADTIRASLNLQNANATTGQTLDLGGKSLGLTSGGILSSGAGASAITGGSLSTPTKEMIITANNSLSINSSIADGIGGATSLTKSGTGALTLSGVNNYTGPTTIDQGTLIVSSDANLGKATSIVFNGGTLQAGADFSTAKQITSASGFVGAIDTASHNVTLTSPNFFINKVGDGTLTLTNAFSRSQVSGGTLAALNAHSGIVSLSNGATLRASGGLGVSGQGTLDIGGPAAAALDIGSNSFGGWNFRVLFGIGDHGSDSLQVAAGSLLSLQPAAFQFDFQSLGGVRTGVDYPIMSFGSIGQAPSPSVFAFAPDMAAAGWAGTFSTTTTGASVRFTAVPEPTVTALLLLQGAACVVLARKKWRR